MQYDPKGERIDNPSPISITGNQIKVRYTDGAEGDLDGLANGRIIDPAGPIDPPGAGFPGGTDTSGATGVGDDGGACFIATAIYGGYDTPEVMILREFRDQILAPLAIGRQLIDWYYARSPAWVEWISDKPTLMAMANVAMTPIVMLADASLHHPFSVSLMMVLILGFAVTLYQRRKKARF